MIEPRWPVQRIKALVGAQAVKAKKPKKEENVDAPIATEAMKTEAARQ
jgi:hypothetical protein